MHVFIDHHQAISLWVGQSLQQNGIDHREDRGVSADSQWKSENDNRREGWIFAEHAEAEAQILPQPLHKRFPASRADLLLGNFEAPLLQTHRAKRLLAGHPMLSLFFRRHL